MRTRDVAWRGGETIWKQLGCALGGLAGAPAARSPSAPTPPRNADVELLAGQLESLQRRVEELQRRVAELEQRLASSPSGGAGP